MAEFAIVATIIQIADVGLRLSLRLYTFGETIASADRTIISISKDISLTSSVLKELGHNLEKDKQAQICSENAIKTAEDVVQECLKVFQEIDGMLEKSIASTSQSGTTRAKWTSAVVGKFRWPFLQPKMQLLRSNLDKLKATLLLMLNVMTYARQLSERSHQTTQLEEHRTLIENLARSKDEYTRKFDDLTRAIVASSINEGSAENQAFLDPQVSPDWFPSTPRKDYPSGIVYELEVYGALINTLLRNIRATEHSIEPLVGTRIRNDVISMHRREANRYENLYGRDRLRAAIGGFAWDVIDVKWEAKTEPKTNQLRGMDNNNKVSGEAKTKPLTNLLKGMDNNNNNKKFTLPPPPPTSNFWASPPGRPSITHDHWVPPISLRGNEEERMVSDTSPMVPGIDNPLPATIPSRSSAGSGVFQSQSAQTARSFMSTSEIVNVPPSHSRNRPESPTNRISTVPSPPMSEESPVDMYPEMSYPTEADFEVKEQDRWLPIANVAQIMKGALPQHAKVMKEAKECMQECVSEFISFITSEAAEKCQQEKRKTMQGEDLLFALTALGFENYAQVLSIYRIGYRRTVHGEIIPDLPRSAQAENSSGAVEPGTKGTEDTLIPKQDAKSGDSTVEHQTQRDEYEQSHQQDWEQDTPADSTSIVDGLLLQWTSLPRVR
ncbi:MAG: hypothetical protein Q9184_002773 [Pyrenodesmia sp. 2 TL-2023]